MKVIAIVLLFPTLGLGLGYTLYRKQQIPLLYCTRARTRVIGGDFLGARADLKAALRRNPQHEQTLQLKSLVDSVLVSASVGADKALATPESPAKGTRSR